MTTSNLRNFSNWVENTVGKGEIAHYEQFLLFPQCFQTTCTADTSKLGLVWETINSKVVVKSITCLGFMKTELLFCQLDFRTNDRQIKTLLQIVFLLS